MILVTPIMLAALRAWPEAVEPPLLPPAAALAKAVPVTDAWTLLPPPVPNREEHPFKGIIEWRGLRFHIEQRPGDVRAGKGWQTTMRAYYGEVDGIAGVDGDRLDVYLGPDPDCGRVYVVHQKIPGTQQPDEDKVMIGWPTQADAVAAYRAHYDRPGFFGGCTPWPAGAFAAHLRACAVPGRLDTIPEWYKNPAAFLLPPSLHKAVQPLAARLDALPPIRPGAVVVTHPPAELLPGESRWVTAGPESPLAGRPLLLSALGEDTWAITAAEPPDSPHNPERARAGLWRLIKATQGQLWIGAYARRARSGKVSITKPHARRKPAHYASGSNHPGEIRGFASLGRNVGVAADQINKEAEHALVSLGQNSDVRVFVDSGAFSEVTFPRNGPPKVVRPISHEQWRERLGLYRRLSAALGDRVSVVAPDRVGDQQITLQRLRRYAEDLREIASHGAEILVPLQRGDLPLVDFLAAVHETLPGVPIVPAIPSKKKATSTEDIAAFVRDAQPERLHLLGLGPANSRAPGLIESIERLSPDTVLTLDSNTIRASVGRSNGPGGGPRILTEATDAVTEEIEDEAQYGRAGLPDYTEEAGWPNDWLSRGQRAELARAAAVWRDLTPDEHRMIVTDPSTFLESEWMQEAPSWGELLEGELMGLWRDHLKATTTTERKERSVVRAFTEATPAEREAWSMARAFAKAVQQLGLFHGGESTVHTHTRRTSSGKAASVVQHQRRKRSFRGGKRGAFGHASLDEIRYGTETISDSEARAVDAAFGGELDRAAEKHGVLIGGPNPLASAISRDGYAKRVAHTARENPAMSWTEAIEATAARLGADRAEEVARDNNGGTGSWVSHGDHYLLTQHSDGRMFRQDRGNPRIYEVTDRKSGTLSYDPTFWSGEVAAAAVSMVSHKREMMRFVRKRWEEQAKQLTGRMNEAERIAREAIDQAFTESGDQSKQDQHEAAIKQARAVLVAKGYDPQRVAAALKPKPTKRPRPAPKIDPDPFFRRRPGDDGTRYPKIGSTVSGTEHSYSKLRATWGAEGWQVHHIGHQTANYPYFIRPPDGEISMVVSHDGHGFKSRKIATALSARLAAGELEISTEGLPPGEARLVGITYSGNPTAMGKAQQSGLFGGGVTQVKAHPVRSPSGKTTIRRQHPRVEPPKKNAGPKVIQARVGVGLGAEHSKDLHLPHLTMLNMGLGRDSLTMLLLLKEGKLRSEGRLLHPKDITGIVFSDTGAEWPRTMALIPRVRAIADELGIPFYTLMKPPDAQQQTHLERLIDVRGRYRAAKAAGETEEARRLMGELKSGQPWKVDDSGTIEERAARGYFHTRASILADYGSKNNVIRICDGGQCTTNHKLAAIRALTDELAGNLLGVNHRSWGAAARRGKVGRHRALIGIAADEVTRAKDYGKPRYERPAYPLVEMGISKADEEAILQRHGFGDVRKSGCFACKFQPVSWYWLLSEKHPDLFAEVVAYEHKAYSTADKPSSGMIFSKLGPLPEAVAAWRERNPGVTADMIERKDYQQIAAAKAAAAQADSPQAALFKAVAGVMAKAEQLGLFGGGESTVKTHTRRTSTGKAAQIPQHQRRKRTRAAPVQTQTHRKLSDADAPEPHPSLMAFDLAREDMRAIRGTVTTKTMTHPIQNQLNHALRVRFDAIEAMHRDGHPLPDTADSADRLVGLSLEEAREAIRHLPAEHMVVFDSNGRQVYRAGPDTTLTYYADADPTARCVTALQVVPESTGALHLLHNHPSGSQLSNNDALVGAQLMSILKPGNHIAAVEAVGWKGSYIAALTGQPRPNHLFSLWQATAMDLDSRWYASCGRASNAYDVWHREKHGRRPTGPHEVDQKKFKALVREDERKTDALYPVTITVPGSKVSVTLSFTARSAQ